MAKLTVVIPHAPTLDMRPNGRVHHMAKHRATKEARSIAGWTTKSAHIDAGRPYFACDRPISVNYTIYWPKGAKRLDADNAAASMKAYTDGISDILTGGRDGSFFFGEVVQDRDRQGPGYTVAVIEQEG